MTAPIPFNCLVLSARSPKSLRALALRYAELLEQGAVFQEVAREAALGRTHLSLRLAVVTGKVAVAVAALRAYAAGQNHPALSVGSARIGGPIAAPALFAPDHDPRRPHIGRAWYAASAEFRGVIDRADAWLGPDAEGRRLSAALWESDDAAAADPGRARAACVAVQCATVALWRSFGVVPVTIRGEGVGELSAAFLLGTLEFDETLRRAARERVSPSNTPPTSLPENDSVMVIGAGVAGDDEWSALARVLGQWYVGGAAVNWSALGGTRGRPRLPNYPFDHQRYWVDVARPVSAAPVDASTTPAVSSSSSSQPLPAIMGRSIDEKIAPASTRAPLVAHLMELPAEDHVEAIEDWVCRAVARVLALPEHDSVPVGVGLFELGMDSLMAVALQHRLERDTGLSLPTTLSFNHPNAGALAGYLASLLALPAADSPAEDSVPASIAALSDEEVEQRLRARLEAVG